MTVWVEGFLVVLMLTNLWLLGSSRLLSCIAAVSVQGVLLGLLPLVIRIDAPLWRLLLQAGASLGLKGIAFPLLLLRAVRSVDARREVVPLVGYSASLLIGVGLLAVSLYTGLRLPLPGSGPAALVLPWHSVLLVPAAIFTALTGLFVIVARRSAIVQALGYLAMESGIAAFGMAIAEQEPLLVEMGTLLDAFVAVFVMGITIFHINREFDHIDSDRLSSLKDSPR
jgi:hydrogenase-4 component E